MGYWEDITREAADRTAQANEAAEPEVLTRERAGTGQPRVPIVDRRIVGPGGEVDLIDDPIFSYIGGDGQRYWDSYAPETQERLTAQLVDVGLVAPGTTGRYTLGAAWEYVLGAANEWEVTPFNALSRLQAESRSRGGRGGGGGGRARGPVIEIPDYPTIAQNAKNMLRQTLGRDPQDFEMAMAGQEMQRQYQRWAETKKQTALSGGGVYEINDPQTMTQAFIEDEWASEISRLEAIDEERANYSVAMNALTQGARMVGG